jgi:hypothetical protein
MGADLVEEIVELIEQSGAATNNACGKTEKTPTRSASERLAVVLVIVWVVFVVEHCIFGGSTRTQPC